MTPHGNILRVAVILASTGRPGNLATVVRHLLEQSLAPSRIILSVVSDADLPEGLPQLAKSGLAPRIEYVLGPKGLPSQRNTGLRYLAGDSDIIAFFDDDYIPSRHCVEQISKFFAAHPDVAGANGRLLADGINSSGITTDEAEAILAEYDLMPQPGLEVHRELKGLYGCNMVYRESAIRDIWFDERLKLYGWQEDIDFATQVSKRGLIVKTDAFSGVHQGVKGGRTSGLRLGYSQVINPLYLMRKGTMSRTFAVRLLVRNVLANHARALRPEPWVDRLGRVKGNWLGLIDVARGRLTPERIETL